MKKSDLFFMKNETSGICEEFNNKNIQEKNIN